MIVGEADHVECDVPGWLAIVTVWPMRKPCAFQSNGVGA